MIQNVGGTSFEIHASVANEQAAAYFVIQLVGWLSLYDYKSMKYLRD
jgi:hypothetical protein